MPRPDLEGVRAQATSPSWAAKIANYLGNGGALEKAPLLAAHQTARRTGRMTGRADAVTLAEVEGGGPVAGFGDGLPDRLNPRRQSVHWTGSTPIGDNSTAGMLDLSSKGPILG